MSESYQEAEIRMLIDGEDAKPDLQALELDSARRALKLLRKVISPELMSEVLESEIREVDSLWRDWAAASDGSWQAAEVEFRVPGITSAQFLEWWESAFADLHGVVYPAFPEHYRFGWVPDPQGGPDDVYLIIEELGHVPFRMFCTFGQEWAAAEVGDGFQLMQPGVGRLEDGTEVVRFMNQIKDADDGLVMKAAVYMVSAVPDDVVTSHRDQEMVEWTHWFKMARAAIAGA